MTNSRPEPASDITDQMVWSGVDSSLSYVESRLMELSQREMTWDQVKRLGRILAKAETEILRKQHTRRRAA